MTIRPIDPNNDGEIELVASRMRDTLVEVLGEERGGSMYTMDWLVQRAKFHLDPASCTGQIFLSQGEDGHITGHAIVRIETDATGNKYGLFSTTYVEPASRRRGIAEALTADGEQWMIRHGMTEAATFTDEFNTGLQALYKGLGYSMEDAGNAFVRLSKDLAKVATQP